jgi:hypothetical protein
VGCGLWASIVCVCERAAARRSQVQVQVQVQRSPLTDALSQKDKTRWLQHQLAAPQQWQKGWDGASLHTPCSPLAGLAAGGARRLTPRRLSRKRAR